VDIWPVGISRDKKSAYLIVEHKDGPNSVERYDFAAGTRTVLMQDADSDPLDMLESLDGRDTVGAVYGLGRPQPRFWSPSSQDALLRMAIVKAFPDSITSITSESDDGTKLVVKTVSDRDPGTYYLIDMVSHKAKFLVRSYPSIDPKQQLASEPFSMKARDGLPLSGFVTKPAGSAGPSPMIVVVHGGPYGERDSWAFDPEVQLLAQHGYAVLRINYRGSEGEGVPFRNKGVMQWGAAMQDDVTDATRWAITQGIADPKRICIYGGSYGAYSALMGAIKEPGLYRCAAGYAGAYDLSKLYTWNDYLNDSYYNSHLWEHYLSRVIGQDDKQLADRSPVKRAGEIKIPVFLAHGHKDGRVDVRHSEAMRDALEKAGHSSEYIDYPLEPHGLVDPADRLDFFTRLVNFFDTNLGSGVANTPQAAASGNQQVAAH
jgi:dipeptidyl aminopeptidase/acylaminoacyl peptidase